MKVSESWLREWVSPKLDTNELAAQITMAGLEVDAVESVAGEFSGVIVGEILSAEQHPDADKLRVCTVGAGNGETAQVVCGALNARVGIKIPFATIGAVLPGNFNIKKAKLRGVESFGMLCAQTELKAGEDDDGLWELPSDAPVGENLQDYLQLDDTVIDVDLTPNRGDCLSIRGIAREVGVLNRLSVNEPEIKPVTATIKDTFPLSIDATSQCPRYIGRVIKNIDVTRPSPLWMQEKLRRAGVRPHDCVVDVTNYVLIELGQPMHAFDLDKLSKKITVRMAKPEEEIELLNGQTETLKDQSLLIADESGPIAIAGIMGGQNTAVTTETKNIFFESAFFSTLALAGKAREYGMHTDASHRYERGVDFALQEQAMERATALLLDICGGEAGPLIIEESPDHIPNHKTVTLRKKRIASGLGFTLSDKEVTDILTRLGLVLESESGKDDQKQWTFAIPSYRFDLEIEEDLLEEIARIYGYNNLPTGDMVARLAMPVKSELVLDLRGVKRCLVSRGYHEAITYSFVSEKLNTLFSPESEAVNLQNPMSEDLAVMRASLWPGLLQTFLHNANRQQSRVRLFESGLCFEAGTSSEGSSSSEAPSTKDKEIKQEPMIAGLLSGSKLPESWGEKETDVDFYDLKGDVEALLELTGDGESFRFEAGTHPALHPGQCALVFRGDTQIGIVGTLHPQIQQELDISQPIYLFQLQQSDYLVSKVPKFTEISKFPGVRRDLALVVDKPVTVGAMLTKVKQAAGEHLKDLKVFDLYVGKGIDTHRKSVALGLTFQHPSRTLNELEINSSIDAVLKGLKEDFSADLR